MYGQYGILKQNNFAHHRDVNDSGTYQMEYCSNWYIFDSGANVVAVVRNVFRTDVNSSAAPSEFSLCLVCDFATSSCYFPYDFPSTIVLQSGKL